MAEVIWSEPAVSDLDAIADYIALDNPAAAAKLVQRIFQHVEQLQEHPASGSKPAEFRGSRSRQLIEPPCRVIYRHEKSSAQIFILHVMRSEQKLSRSKLLRDLKKE